MLFPVFPNANNAAGAPSYTSVSMVMCASAFSKRSRAVEAGSRMCTGFACLLLCFFVLADATKLPSKEAVLIYTFINSVHPYLCILKPLQVLLFSVLVIENGILLIDSAFL